MSILSSYCAKSPRSEADDLPLVLREIMAGDRLTTSQAAQLCPSQNGRGVSLAAVTRWMKKGALGESARVKLEHVRFGGRLATSRAALGRFLVALTGNGAVTAADAVTAARRPGRPRDEVRERILAASSNPWGGRR
jgi:Protein of unknown function (DUF1580)